MICIMVFAYRYMFNMCAQMDPSKKSCSYVHTSLSVPLPVRSPSVTNLMSDGSNTPSLENEVLISSVTSNGRPVLTILCLINSSIAYNWQYSMDTQIKLAGNRATPTTKNTVIIHQQKLASHTDYNFFLPVSGHN